MHIGVRNKLSNQNKRTNDRINVQLTGSTAEIYKYLLANGVINNAFDLAQKLDKSIITIQRGLKQLVELGIAERIGSNKTGFWRLKK